MEIMVAETLTVNSCLNVQLICAAQKYRFHTKSNTPTLFNSTKTRQWKDRIEKIRPNPYKSKKMTVAGLWNNLPWSYSLFQAEKV